MQSNWKVKKTPIHFLERTSNHLDIPVWIKREDLCYEEFLGGSKVRKLLNIFPKLIENKITDILTIGTFGSHHVNATAKLGKIAGIRVHAILLPQPHTSYARLVYKDTKRFMKTYIHSSYLGLGMNISKYLYILRNNRKHSYFIYPGGSNREGIMAYKEAGAELYEDMIDTKNNYSWDYQICIYGTGGITAGLEASRQIYPSLPKIFAVQVYPGFWNTKSFVKYHSRKVLNQNEVQDWKDSDLILSRLYIGKGYGFREKVNEKIVNIFKEDSIFLDSIYLARAGKAIEDLSQKKQRPKGLLLWYSSPGNPFQFTKFCITK